MTQHQKSMSYSHSIGCTPSQLRGYIEQQFTEWMTWNNHGGRDHEVKSWELDHVRAISTFDLENAEQSRRANHWSNLMPLEWQENSGKSDKEDPNFAWDETRGRFMWSESSLIPNPELPPVQEGDAERDEELEEDDDAEENV